MTDRSNFRHEGLIQGVDHQGGKVMVARDWGCYPHCSCKKLQWMQILYLLLTQTSSPQNDANSHLEWISHLNLPIDHPIDMPKVCFHDDSESQLTPSINHCWRAYMVIHSLLWCWFCRGAVIIHRGGVSCGYEGLEVQVRGVSSVVSFWVLWGKDPFQASLLAVQRLFQVTCLQMGFLFVDLCSNSLFLEGSETLD